MQTAAQLLDELMGRDRNLLPNQKSDEVSWESPEVCKYYLVDFCPHELFINTRSDLGPCEKVHDEALKRQYEKNPRRGKMGYDEDFLHYLQQIMADVDRRIRRGHSRLIIPPSLGGSNPNPSGTTAKNEEKAAILTTRINELVEQVEQLGCEGKVEEAQGMMKLCEQLKEEREQLNNSMNSIGAQEKQMEVCDVCGAFLIVGDAQSRVDDHLMGKQHMGYAKIKATIEELKNKNRKIDEEKERLRQVERETREKERAREREERMKRQEERERERKRERERHRDRRRSRSRERRRSRSREKRRHRSRSRERRSRSREKRQSRDKDRGRDRDRDRAHRDKRRRSRSRERQNSHSRSLEARSHSEEKRRSKEIKSESPMKDSREESRRSENEDEKIEDRSDHREGD